MNLLYVWEGDGFKPLSRCAKAADKEFVIGERYELQVVAMRSSATHNHFFAALHEAWTNLPEPIADHFPTEEHLRKYLLIKAGFRDETSFLTHSKAEAQRFAGYLRSIDGYSFIQVDGKLVTRWTAKSQAMKKMGKVEFQKSKQAVLEQLAKLIGVTPDELSSNAGRAA